MISLNSLRYGTPDGNIYIATAQFKDRTIITGDITQEGARTRAKNGEILHSNTFPAPFAARLGEYSRDISVKSPMLIVGANNYVRSKLPFFILQTYDVHLFFMPNSETVWKVGAILINKTKANIEPVHVFSESKDIQDAILKLSIGITIEAVNHQESNTCIHPKLSVWWTNWIYRCPKIALKDVLHLEPYKNSEVA